MKNSICAHITEIGKVGLCSKNIPAPSDGELLIEAEYSSISPGTERSLINGDILALPQDLGYSMAGRVTAIGANVLGFKVGDAVVSTAKHASIQLINQRSATLVPTDVDLRQACFFNLAHTALYGVRRADIQIGEPLLIIGQGLIGVLSAQLAKLAGALPVIVCDVDDIRLSLAKSLGADFAINSAKEPDALNQVIRSLTSKSLSVVIEATGLRSPLEEAIALVGERGRVVMMSTTQGALSASAIEQLMTKGASLIGAYVNSKPFSSQLDTMEITSNWPPTINEKSEQGNMADGWTSEVDIGVVLDLIKHKRLDLSSLITHEFRPQEIPEAYELVYKNDPTLLGGVIDWQN